MSGEFLSYLMPSPFTPAPHQDDGVQGDALFTVRGCVHRLASKTSVVWHRVGFLNQNQTDIRAVRVLEEASEKRLLIVKC